MMRVRRTRIPVIVMIPVIVIVRMMMTMVAIMSATVRMFGGFRRSYLDFDTHHCGRHIHHQCADITTDIE